MDHGETISLPQVVIDIAAADPAGAAQALTVKDVEMVVASLTVDAEPISEADARSEILQILTDYSDSVELYQHGSNVDFYVTGYDGEQSYRIGEIDVRVIGVEEGFIVPMAFGPW